jgi:hypothetical protein
LPKESGPTGAISSTVTPVPERATGAEEGVASSVVSRSSAETDALVDGENTTDSCRLSPGCRLNAVVAVTVKALDVVETLLMFTGPEPLFITVTVWAGLGLPTG